MNVFNESNLFSLEMSKRSGDGGSDRKLDIRFSLESSMSSVYVSDRTLLSRRYNFLNVLER